ncbi:tRNA lysidine(34) synthetase TilS [Chryseobacterium suipulveris]|uniref:tRNA(Ile)-lysidine synthase n=1 Tax=Chryseobacterium suipulveris TaxID=2929800 RepID=A0ABY4BR86_9FLAO|nr:tRNA lysidine(34) synthetase TilS [Chryseobacterium suipulveris]UOE41409.1 tRNA lysidine(34) synthetase TilS [Chryseobacterium suipulveris]
MLTEKDLRESLQLLAPNPELHHYLLAVSGGVDSMVLLNLFQVSDFKFQVAHINYKLRGKESNLDQKLVEDFCRKNSIKFHLYEVSAKDNKPANSIQNWARNLRYDFFRKIQNQEKIEFLVTAHHLNDQLETFLINFSRGTGIKGLSGIPANDHQILRPLLNFSKDEIYEFAENNGIKFREDASNQKDDYLRNRVRNKIVPEILETAPNFLNQFGDTLSYLKSANRFIEHSVSKSFQEILVDGNDAEFTLNRKKLLQLDSFIINEIIRGLGFSRDEIEKVVNAENGKFFRSRTHEIKITRNEILCVRRPEK